MNSIFIILLLTKEIATQTLTLCNTPKIRSTCELVCKTPDLKKTVAFKRQYRTFGECTVVVDQTICEPFNNRFLIGQDKSSNETRLTIKSLDKLEDEGTWYCEYDNSQSPDEQLKTYGITNKTSNTPNLTEYEIDGFKFFHFETDCLMPEPTAWLNCKVSKEMCSVSNVGKQKCIDPTQRSYNVTCKMNAECVHSNASLIEVKVLDDITIQTKVIPNQQKKSEDKEDENTPPVSNGHDLMAIILPIIGVVIVAIIVLVMYLLRHQKYGTH